MCTCAHNQRQLATEICHYTSDRLPPLSSPHAPIFLPLLPVRASCRNARGLQQQQQRGRCAARRSTRRQRRRHAAVQQRRRRPALAAAAQQQQRQGLEAPRDSKESSSSSPRTARNTGQPFNLEPSSGLKLRDGGVSTKRWCNCRQSFAISQFFWLSLTNTVSDPARSK